MSASAAVRAEGEFDRHKCLRAVDALIRAAQANLASAPAAVAPFVTPGEAEEVITDHGLNVPEARFVLARLRDANVAIESDTPKKKGRRLASVEAEAGAPSSRRAPVNQKAQARTKREAVTSDLV